MTSHEPRSAVGDSEPRAELADLVHALIGRRVHDLRVEFDGRGLVLRGRAESFYVKQLAQHVAMAAVGFPLSANEIVVAYPSSDSPRPAGEALDPVSPSHTAALVPHTPRDG